jgi:TolA-binding protein
VTLEPFDRARMNPEALIGGGSFSGRILIPGEGQIKILPGLPPGDWPNLFIDPESGDSFRWNQEFRGQLREQIPQDLDERMESLNARIEELQKMLDRLVEQAKDVAEQAERD